jgi:four helix bundle protein
VTAVTDRLTDLNHLSLMSNEESMMSKHGYKDLFVWRESIAFVPDVYAIVQGFPAHERFALSDQIRRAVVSIPANIAEGQARFYPREFLKHLRIARGSLAELHTLFVVSEQLGYITPAELLGIEHKISSLVVPIHRLVTSLQMQLNTSSGNHDHLGSLE